MTFAAWDFSCLDWKERLAAGVSLVPKLPLIEPQARAARRYFDRLRIPDVPGQPTMATAAGDWFRDIVGAAFGSVDLETGDRAIEEIFVLVPKKNSKTTNSAALGLVALLMNKTPRAEGIIVGPTHEVAETCFNQAVGMIEADEYLASRFHVIEHKKTIVDLAPDEETGRPKRSKLKIKSFDRKVVTGTIPAFAIIDELHLMATMNNAELILGQLTGGAVTRKPTFIVYITTQSEEPPTGVFREKLAYARGIRDGVFDGDHVRMLPVLYEFPLEFQADESKPWLDPATWHQVLPNLGRSVLIDKLIPKLREREDTAPHTVPAWASQHLNIEVGIGTRADRWIGADYWLKAGRPELTLDDIIESSDVCVVGIDGGGLDDLLGLAVLGRHAVTRCWQHWGKAWADRDVLTLRKSISSKLRELERANDLTLVDNLETEANPEIVEICVRLRDAGVFPAKDKIGMDPENIQQLVDDLIEAGFSIEDIAAISQGYKLNSAIKRSPVKLKNGTLVHCAQPIMSWAVGNAKIDPKGNAAIVTKAMSGTAKIDPVMALFNTIMLMQWNPTADTAGSISIPADYLIG